jgi:hypothetical protein
MIRSKFGGSLGASDNIGNLENYGAAGDGVTDDLAAINSAISRRTDGTTGHPLRIRGDRKKYRVSAAPSATTGVDLEDGVQVIIKPDPVGNPTNESVWIPRNNGKPPVIGTQYLYGLHQKMINFTLFNNFIKVLFTGDSTMNGIGENDFSTLDCLFANYVNDKGITSLAVSRSTAALRSTETWNSTVVATEIADYNPDLWVIRYGFDDGSLSNVPLAARIASLRGALTQIRAAQPLSSEYSIILMTPLTAHPTSSETELREPDLEYLIDAYRHVADEFQCAFIDSYSLAPRASTFWMGLDQSTPGNTINSLISKKLFELISPQSFPPGIFVKTEKTLSRVDALSETARDGIFRLDKENKISILSPSYVFDYSGFQLSARYAKAFTMKTPRAKNVYLSGDGGINVDVDGYIRWSSFGLELNQAGCIQLQQMVIYNGTPARDVVLFRMGTLGSNDNLINFIHGSDGNLQLEFYGPAGVLDSTTTYAWSPTALTNYVFEIGWSTLPNNVYLFLDGTLIGVGSGPITRDEGTYFGLEDADVETSRIVLSNQPVHTVGGFSPYIDIQNGLYIDYDNNYVMTNMPLRMPQIDNDGTVTNIDNFEQIVFSMNLTGAINVTIPVFIARTNIELTLIVVELSSTPITVPSQMLTTAPGSEIPLRFRPGSTISNVIIVNNNSYYHAGTVTLASSGVLTITPGIYDLTQTFVDTCGFHGFSLKYIPFSAVP